MVYKTKGKMLYSFTTFKNVYLGSLSSVRWLHCDLRSNLSHGCHSAVVLSVKLKFLSKTKLKLNSFQNLRDKLFCLGSWNHIFLKEDFWLVGFGLVWVFFSSSLFVELTLTMYFLFLPKLTWIALKVIQIQTLFWEPSPLSHKLSHSV